MKKFLLFLIIVVSLVSLTACGSNSSKAKEGNKETAEGENALERIQNSGKLIIGTTGNYRPFSYMDSNNELTGYDIEWANIIAEELGVEAEFITGQFSGLIPGLVANKFDIILSGVNITEERAKSIDFSEPYAQDGAVAVIKKGSNSVKSINDIEGKVVGVNAGSAFEEVVKQIGGYKELKVYPGAAESFSDLVSGRVDVVAIGLPAAAEYIQNSPSGKDIQIIGEPFDVKGIGVAIPKEQAELKAEINRIIQAKKEDGTYNELSQKYFGLSFEDLGDE
ncbi:transporter substrate-binding domain-containing protein [Bacillus sp. EB106-08-02-XG196]|jgi:ABC-type amino acid transport substrate-binding protein|uniref:substrate-binding periplasmic protein n=1 Tax=Bacillus sp. EB106-08-02-XG196 TaxID=2737049 RepID=UPI0015C448AA|nr:ABC transporter substrate-binding protein [Bacillus sp. EB106-08-02-XG196]NWQ44657.1 transporter substrate-binding domain-containing protein [Bacillus sp. EB106-08-02-XG196]